MPPPRSNIVHRATLISRLNATLDKRPGVTLISAPAGFGKTTLVSEWVAACATPVAWLSLDEGDNELKRFLTYLVASLGTVLPRVGDKLFGALRSPQPLPAESILTALLNEATTVPHDLSIVIDDYHVIDARPVDDALAFILEHLPTNVHLVIITREDPQLQLARLRAAGRLTEFRISDLRFTAIEAAEFLNQVMGLALSAEDVAALDERTEGWIAGLQLAAISMQGIADHTAFIRSFTGSHHFVMDYLVEEVLQRQPETIQRFLLRTSILKRFCGPLCDAVLDTQTGSSQKTLEYLERTNLFIIPLDNERRWYRYHHLFADLLSQRLQSDSARESESGKSFEDLGIRTGGARLRSRGESHSNRVSVAGLHIRASKWHEENSLEIEAFEHATAANDYERAERLIEGKGMPLHFRGVVAPVLNWLESLPTDVLDKWPSLWTAFASTLSVTGQITRVEPALKAAESALERAVPNDKTRDLIGRVAAIRATNAVAQNRIDIIINESRRALQYLDPKNIAFRTSTAWKLGFAYHLQGEREEARQAYQEVVTAGQASGNAVFTLMATIGLGHLAEGDIHLHQAAQLYRRVLEQVGDKPLPFAGEAHLGLARVCYEWNDLANAELHAKQSLNLVQQVENNDRIVAGKVLLARLKLAIRDLSGADSLLSEADRMVREHNFASRISDVVGAQVFILIQRGKLNAAADLAEKHKLPISQARAHLARGSSATALSIVEAVRRQAEEKSWHDERLKAMILQAIALKGTARVNQAVEVLGEALSLAEPGGMIRVFIDEGRVMAQLLAEAAGRGMKTEFIDILLDVFRQERLLEQGKASEAHSGNLIEPLSQRELEVLRLIADGLSNREISERLFVALITVKGHNQRIFSKLQVQRRTEAVARARELGLL